MSYTAEQARAEIAQLVRTFKASELSLMAEAEAQIENNFVRPLFQCLNWNTRNAGLAVPDYEFLVQKTQRYGKRPDYVLQLDGQHLLVMDAKQVKYDMHDPRWMNQVYAYAYSTQSLSPARRIDFAVLTDFQEFVVLDCTLYAGNPKAVGNLRVLDWRCDDYVRQFDTLWELFERDNVRRHARTRGSGSPSGLWARYLSPKKVKANRIPPDKAFLAEMDDDRTGWRVILAKDMKKRNPQADGALITAAVQLWIDRLIFVKVLSDREIEEDYLTQLAEIVERDGVAESDTSWFSACRGIFDKLNQFYDGSVFEARPELEAVTVSNKVVRDVLRELQPENSPYNFSVLPVETLGTIYERFLGRVVRTTDQRVKIEDKPEVRKAGGVYYTPQYIVEYIVRHTLGKLLEQCATPEDVARLKILDPACGSGSFLLGAYQALIERHIRYYSHKDRLTSRHRSAAYHDSDGRVRLTARLKRQILLNNLYGVDIDAQAVEVTRFSLSLKALEDTRAEELTEERSLFQQTVLPNLSGNIKCGNSLIGPEYFSGQMFTDPAELKRVNPFDWAMQFAAIMAGGGFDAVIGNPPYIRIQTLQETSPGQVAFLKRSYPSAGSGNYDIYVVFVEKGLSLLGPHGRLGFILPHKFFNSKYGQPLRALIAQGRHLTHIVHFGDQQVFEGATTYTALMFLHRQGGDSFELVRVNDLEGWRAGKPQTQGLVRAESVTAAEWNLAVGHGAMLFERLSAMPVKLRDVAQRIAQGIRTSANEVYVLGLVSDDAEWLRARSVQLTRMVLLEKGLVSLFLKGREIKRYQILPSEQVVIIPYRVEKGRITLVQEGDLSQDFPSTYAYLRENKSYLEARERGRMKGPDWYGYVYPKNIEVMTSPKILVPDIADRASFALDEHGQYAFVSGYGITLKDEESEAVRYVLGLLNSKMLDFYLKQVSTTLRGGFFRYFTQFLEELPIRTIDFSDPFDVVRHDRMVALVESMLALHKHKTSAKTRAEQELYQRQIEETDRQIDALVYELYGLTEEEIKIVEGR